MIQMLIPIAVAVGAYFYGEREAMQSPSMRLPVGNSTIPLMDKRVLVGAGAAAASAFTGGTTSNALAGLAAGSLGSVAVTEYRRSQVVDQPQIPGAVPGQLPGPQTQQTPPGQRKFFVPFRI